MTVRPTSVVTLARLGPIVASLTACGIAGGYLSPSGSTITLMAGWELAPTRSAGGVNGFQRAYFEVAQLPPAATYRVSVWDYTLLQNPGSGWI